MLINCQKYDRMAKAERRAAYPVRAATIITMKEMANAGIARALRRSAAICALMSVELAKENTIQTFMAPVCEVAAENGEIFRNTEVQLALLNPDTW